MVLAGAGDGASSTSQAGGRSRTAIALAKRVLGETKGWIGGSDSAARSDASPGRGGSRRRFGPGFIDEGLHTAAASLPPRAVASRGDLPGRLDEDVDDAVLFRASGTFLSHADRGPGGCWRGGSRTVGGEGVIGGDGEGEESG